MSRIASLRSWISSNGVIVVLVIAAWFTLLPRPTTFQLLDDSDTRVALAKIAERNDPWSWFTTDWPLENHFYRPISTLSLELDQRIWPGSMSGFLFTNAVLALGCVLALVWLMRELGFRPLEKALGAWILLVWLVEPLIWVAGLIGVALMAGFPDLGWPSGKRAWALLLPLPFIFHELTGVESLPGRIMDWVPGRTASCATFFGLFALAAWVAARRQPWWIVPSTASLYLALGSYEQAVILPFLMIGTAGLLVLQKRAISLWLLLPPIACLVVYAVLRQSILPPGPSGYIDQQMRSTGLSWHALSDYLFPVHRDISSLKIRWETGVYAWLDSGTWTAMFRLISFVAVSLMVWKSPHRWRLIWCYVASAVAFLPMAFLKPFEHYHLMPMAIRAAFVAALVAVLLDQTSPSRSKFPDKIK